MAGTIIELASNGDTDWTQDRTILFQFIGKGGMQLSLTNMDDETEPQFEAGSVVEIDGSYCRFETIESITGWAAIANSTDVYIKLSASGTSVSASFTTTAPTWSGSKQGFYVSSDRYIGGLYKDVSGNYCLKWTYTMQNTDNCLQLGVVRPLLYKYYSIGDWDMPTTAQVDITVESGQRVNTKILSLTCTIFDDGDGGSPVGVASGVFNEDYNENPVGNPQMTIFGVQTASTDTTIRIVRLSGGAYDNTSFDKTSYNRGYIYIVYKA